MNATFLGVFLSRLVPRHPETDPVGVNRSSVHIDLMIGTGGLTATGITHTGRRASLVADGTWQLNGREWFARAAHP